MSKIFDLSVRRSVDPSELAWPGLIAAQTDGWLGGNKNYCSLIGMAWTEVQRVRDLEGKCVSRVSASSDPSEEEGAVEDELYEMDEDLFGLDIGVASPVAALSAAGCIPFASCNGGAFGRSHYEVYPLVAFYAPACLVLLLLECAEEAGVGLINGDEGELVLQSDTIGGMAKFTESVLHRSNQLDALKVARHEA